MIVKCKNCNTSFRVSAEKISSRGAYVCCSRCNTTFPIGTDDQEPSPKTSAGKKSRGTVVWSPTGDPNELPENLEDLFSEEDLADFEKTLSTEPSAIPDQRNGSPSSEAQELPLPNSKPRLPIDRHADASTEFGFLSVKSNKGKGKGKGKKKSDVSEFSFDPLPIPSASQISQFSSLSHSPPKAGIACLGDALFQENIVWHVTAKPTPNDEKAAQGVYEFLMEGLAEMEIESFDEDSSSSSVKHIEPESLSDPLARSNERVPGHNGISKNPDLSDLDASSRIVLGDSSFDFPEDDSFDEQPGASSSNRSYDPAESDPFVCEDSDPFLCMDDDSSGLDEVGIFNEEVEVSSSANDVSSRKSIELAIESAVSATTEGADERNPDSDQSKEIETPTLPAQKQVTTRVSYVAILGNVVFVATLLLIGFTSFIVTRTDGTIGLSIFSAERIFAAISTVNPEGAHIQIEKSGVYTTGSGRRLLYTRGVLFNDSDKSIESDEIQLVGRILDLRGNAIDVSEAVFWELPSPEDLWRISTIQDIRALRENQANSARTVSPNESTPFFVLFTEAIAPLESIRVETELQVRD